MTRTVTIEELREADACCEQRQLFVGTFGDAAVLSRESITKAAEAGLDLEWAVSRIVPQGLREEYEAKRQSLWEEYEAERQLLLDEYRDEHQPLWEEYEAKHQLLLDEYEAKHQLLFIETLVAYAEEDGR